MGRHEDEHLRRFLAARRAGDAAAMRRWWEELVIDFHDRMDGLVGVNHQGRLDDFEHEDAVQRAMMRFSKDLIGTFHGSSMGELVNATRSLCRFACIDVQRDAMRHRHQTLEEVPAGDDRPAPQWEREAALEAWTFEQHQGDVADFLERALPQLLDSRRAVVERTFAGMPLPDICAELGLSHANAYQLRSRGLKDLAKLYEQEAS